MMSNDAASRPGKRSQWLNQLKRQAKELLSSFQTGHADAVAEVGLHYGGADATTFALHDAQLVLARAYRVGGRWGIARSSRCWGSNADTSGTPGPSAPMLGRPQAPPDHARTAARMLRHGCETRIGRRRVHPAPHRTRRDPGPRVVVLVLPSGAVQASRCIHPGCAEGCPRAAAAVPRSSMLPFVVSRHRSPEAMNDRFLAR